jgi:hypothetical protein
MMNGHDSDISPKELAALYREHDRFRDEQRAITEYAALTKRVDATGLIHREQEDALVTAPDPTPDGLDDLPPFSERQGNVIAYVISGLRQEWTRDLQQLRQEYETATDRRVGTLENENRELRGMLGEALSRLSEARKIAETNAQEQGAAISKLERAELTRQVRDKTLIERSDRVSELMRDNAASRAELARQQFEQAFSVRDARLRTMEEKFTMLLHFLSLSHDLPRGL